MPDVGPLLGRELTTLRPHRGWEWTAQPIVRDHRVPAFGFLHEYAELSHAEELRLRCWFTGFLTPTGSAVKSTDIDVTRRVPQRTA